MVQSQKNLIIQMLIHSFSENKRILGIVKSAAPHHLMALFTYIYELVEEVGIFFLTKNKSTVILYFRESNKQPSYKIIPSFCRLLMSCNWKKIISNRRINKSIKETRDREAESAGYSDYIYIWFLAGGKITGGYRGLLEVVEHLRMTSKKSNLPIYLETTIPRMVHIYERAGFQFYEQKQIGNHLVNFGKYNWNEQ